MAPEQAAGEAVDHRTDLYAFGATLFHLATGCPPFEGGDLAHHHRHTPPPDPRDRIPEFPASLALLIAKLMAKAPENRVQTAGELVAILQKLLGAAA
jgi:serine/threonine-protein kinase